jgi:hypothetical protein
MRILVVEDNSVNAMVAVSLLGKLGCTAVSVSGGKEALETLSTSRFDAVLMDMHMPSMDGCETTRAIRSGAAGERNRSVPIIAQTASVMFSDRRQCLDAGMNGFVVKPVSREELAAALMDSRSAPEHPWTGPAFDRKGALERLGGDEGILREASEMFVGRTPEILRELSEASGRSDLDALAAIAHTYKSTSAVVGAARLSSMFEALEKAARDKSPGAVPDLISRIGHEFSTFGDAFAAVK